MTASMAAAICCPTVVMAQRAGPASQEERVVSSPVAGEVEEIIVTARKRSESLQSVPIAISALSAETLERNRVIDVDSLGEIVPGVTIAGAAPNGFPVIRGITSRVSDAGSETAVGQYIDEIYQPRVANQLTGLLDLERVEVLKGPQGTLFGRNTIAGAINYVTKKPTDTPTGFAQAGVGNRGLMEFRGSVSGPVLPNLAGRISILGMKNDGNTDIVDAAGKTIANDGDDNFGVRLALRWTPTDALELNASYTRLRLEGASIDQNTGAPAGPIAPALANFLHLYTPSQPVVDYRDRKVGLSGPGLLQRDTDMATLRIDWELGSELELTSLSSYQYYRHNSLVDVDYDVKPIVMSYGNQRSDTYSQELRLAGGGKAFRWSVGANYFYDDQNLSEKFAFTVPPPFDIEIASSTRVKTTSWALFGQAYLTPIENLTFAGGVRYSYDKRDYRKMNNPGLPTFGDVYDSANVPDWDTSPSWDDISYTGSVDYHITPGVMVYASHSKGYRSGGIQERAPSIAVARFNYGPETAKQYEIGLKSTLFDRRVLLNIAAYHIDYSDIQVTQQSFTSFLGSAVTQNAASARMRGIEVESIIGINDNISINLGYSYNRAKYKDYKASDDIPASIAALGPRCGGPRTFGCEAGDYIYDGVPFFYAPRHTLNVGVDFQSEMKSGAVIRFNPSYVWKSSFLTSALPQSIHQLPGNVLNDLFLRQPSFGLINANLSLELPGKQWTFGAWVRNLTDKRHVTLSPLLDTVVNGNAPTFRYGDRRTYGVTLTWRH